MTAILDSAATMIGLQCVLGDGRLQASGLLDPIDDGLELGQRAGEPCGKTIRQQTAGTMTLWTIPAPSWSTSVGHHLEIRHDQRRTARLWG